LLLTEQVAKTKLVINKTSKNLRMPLPKIKRRLRSLSVLANMFYGNTETKTSNQQELADNGNVN
jgi:hypothetical protein